MRVALLLHAALAATVVALVPAAAAAQSSDPLDASPGRIDGRVVTWYGELLPNVTVTLATRAGNADRRATTTSAGGAFTFEDVSPGPYVLRASAAGYTDWAITGTADLAAREVAVRGGEHVNDVEITMRRTGSIAGRIVRADGTPAPGTEVTVAVREGDRLQQIAAFRTRSEWDGRYQIDGLPPGEFQILVVPRPDAPPAGEPLPVDVSAAPLRFEPTLYPGVPASEPGGTVAVYEGVATEGIDVWLMPAPQRFTVSGRVFWPDGVQVERIAIEYGGPPGVRSGVWYVDDPGGLFTLEGISRGPLVLLARGESTRGPLLGLAATDVLIGPVEEVRIVLAPPGSVGGRLTFEGPLPPAASPQVVLAHALLPVSPLFPTESAAVGRDGRFQIPHARGTYRLDVIGLPPGWRVQRITRNGVPLVDSLIIVGTEERVTDLDIRVGP